ncbi:efflux RND transporter permease subunit [Dethiosulfovibrio sp. F2B]|uniref:efflux RND transporter permease subunit n=1 Tax=Dethiosulfovibrio faecalis TaxID=2720018 RepID=UPI001F301D1C|nr:efflux RND transporter permease subunit [Dethiosulfovibrio faecalis]MCF4151570.1 efflux RND transporter permease subunit [Dethiosulfovibrio faecalis]
MRKLIETALKRPVTVVILTTALIVFGIYAFANMGMERMPNVDLPYVMVQTTMEGASPAVVDNDITDVLEEQINTIDGIKNIDSSSYEGRSVIAIEFQLDKDVDVAASDVRAKVNLARGSLPDEADDPVVDKFSFDDMAVMTIAVNSTADMRSTSTYVDKIARQRLQTVKGVGNAQAVGLREREIRVWLDPIALQARGLTATDVKNAINEKHVELPAGRIESESQEFGIRLAGEYGSIEALSQMAVARRNGALVRLKDVARVEDGFEDRRSVATYDGKETILIQIRKQRGTNEVALAKDVKAMVEKLNAAAPKGISLKIVQDTSRFIIRSMNGVRGDIIMGIMMTSIIMFLFLRTIRATFVAVITIPVCLIGTLIVLDGLGITINNMTMLGLSLAVGMVVDSTTVVMENIHRHREMGKTAMRSSADGGTEVGFSVLAGAATTMAVFLPVAFMSGIIGRFFYAFGITVAMTILISLILSLTLTPFLCSRILGRQTESALTRAMEAPFLALERLYTGLLGAAVRHRLITLIVAVAIFVSGLLMAGRLGSEFFPNEDRGRFKINFELSAEASLQQTEDFLLELGNLVRQDPRVVYTYGTAGSGQGGEVYKGTITVELVPRDERPPFYVIMGEYRKKLAVYRDVDITLGRWGGSDISLVLQGDSTEELADIGEAMKAELEQKSVGLVDITTDLRMNKPRINLDIDRNLADDLGISMRDLSTEIKTYFGGTNAGSFKEGGYRYDIRLRAGAEDRDAPEKISDIAVRGGDGELVRLPGLVTPRIEMAPNVIKRHNRQRSLEIGANTDGISPGEGIVQLEDIFDRYAPSDGSVTMSPAGDTENMRESFASLTTALAFAILLVYMVMAIQFESFMHPLTIMFALPLMTAGAFGLLLLAGVRLSVMSFMGIILLVGIVVNNAILLVDFANQHREQGMDKISAIMKAAPLRLRPILMTTCSTMVGMLPIALGLSEGGEIRQPMSITVIGGLFTATLLTLVVIPVIYLIVDDMTDRVKRVFSRAGAIVRGRRMAASGRLPGQTSERGNATR